MMGNILNRLEKYDEDLDSIQSQNNNMSQKFEQNMVETNKLSKSEDDIKKEKALTNNMNEEIVKLKEEIIYIKQNTQTKEEINKMLKSLNKIEDKFMHISISKDVEYMKKQIASINDELSNQKHCLNETNNSSDMINNI